MELALGSTLIRRDQWNCAARNPFAAQSRARMRWDFASGFLAANNPIESVGAWLDDDGASLDVSLRDWLVERRLDDRTVNLCWTTNPYFGSSAFDVSALQCVNNDV